MENLLSQMWSLKALPCNCACLTASASYESDGTFAVTVIHSLKTEHKNKTNFPVSEARSNTQSLGKHRCMVRPFFAHHHPLSTWKPQS